MGLFDEFKSELQPTFDVQKAIMTIVMATNMLDSNLSDKVLAQLRSMCALSQIFSANSREKNNNLMEFAINIGIGEQPLLDGINKAKEVLKPELRETAFAFAVEVALADEVIDDEKEEFISELARTLGVSDELGRMIIHSAIIRNRKSELQPTFDVQKAIMTIVIATNALDSNLSDKELNRLVSICFQSPFFSANSREEHNAVMEWAIKTGIYEQHLLNAVKKATFNLEVQHHEKRRLRLVF